MSKLEPIEVLIRNQMVCLVRRGATQEQARIEASESVEIALNDLARLGPEVLDTYIYVLIRRSRVFRMRTQGMTYSVICERLGISRQQASNDYEAEMLRQRAGG